VDAGIWDEIGLELRDINVECSIETQRSRQRGDDLTEQTVQVGVGWALDVQVPSDQDQESLSR